MSEYLTDKQVEECKYMLLKKAYYHNDKSLSKNDGDDLILLKYLQELGNDKDQALKLWIPIYESAYGEYNEEKMHGRLMFDSIWAKALLITKRPTKLIHVYQSELDAINAMVSPRWIKELLLIVLIKTKSKNKYTYHDPIINKLVKYTSISKRVVNNYMDALKYFEDYGFLKYELEDWYDNTDGMTYQIDKYTYQFPKPSGDVVITLNKDNDIVNYFDLITMYKKCTQCGSMFEYTTKTKRNICECCWKHNETIKRENRRKKQLVLSCPGE